MFLNDLIEPQKIDFHNLAVGLIYSDEILDMNEALFITRLDNEMGISGKKIPKNKNPEELFEVFDTKKSKAIVILELLNLAYSDDNFNIDENSYIQHIADSLKISPIDFTEMKWWAKKNSDIFKEALRFF